MTDLIAGQIALRSRFLPTNVKPTHYTIALEPDLESRVYEGAISIDLLVKEDTKSITLNVHPDIDLISTQITSNGRTVRIESLTRHADTERYTVLLCDSLLAGNEIQLSHKFTGYLNDQQNGFYRTTYRGEDGKDRHVAATQGQPTSMRRAFPCFDEPNLKATFSITLAIKSHETCASNMDIASEREIGGKKHVTFNPTPPMSPYLVCFIVGEDFHHFVTSDWRVPISIYTAFSKDARPAKFTLDLEVKSMKFFEKAFQFKYPLPKLDLASFPGFRLGAMENWGLMTFNDNHMLWDERTHGISAQQLIVEICIHETAHQWFGDLVTNKTWDSTWLNEGFATWASLYAMNDFYPEWRIWERFVSGELADGLSLDGLRSSHPIELAAEPGQEAQILDAISYQKGSVVLRMISTFIGEEKFVEGVAHYVNKFAFSSSLSSDLWESLTHVAGVDIGSIMDPWIKQTGYPVLLVEENPDDNTIVATQHRYLRTGDVAPEEDMTWPIVLNILTEDGIQSAPILTHRQAKYSVPMDFYKINANHTGFFRTLYPPSRYLKLGEAAQTGLLNVQDRAGLIGDLGALAAAGYVSTSSLLRMLDGFRHETEITVWRLILAQLAAIEEAWMFEDQQIKEGLAKFLQSLVGDALRKSGWEFSRLEDPKQQQLKVALFSASAGAGSPRIIEACLKMFQKYIAGDDEAIDSNLRLDVFATAIEYGSAKEFGSILNLFFESSDYGIKSDCRKALGRTKEPKLMKKALDLLISDRITPPDMNYLLAGFWHRRENISTLWNWTKLHWQQCMKRLPSDIPRPYFVKGCIQGCSSRAGYEDIKQFFENNPTTGIDLVLAQVLETIKANVQWVERDREDVRAWLEEHKYIG